MDDSNHDSSEFDVFDFETSEFDDAKFDNVDFDDIKAESLEVDVIEFDNTEHENVKFANTPLEKPQFETPQLEVPEFEAPELEAPELEKPEFETPQFENAELEDAQFETSRIETYDYDPSESDLVTSDLGVSEMEMSGLEPELEVGDAHAVAPVPAFTKPAVDQTEHIEATTTKPARVHKKSGSFFRTMDMMVVSAAFGLLGLWLLGHVLLWLMGGSSSSGASNLAQSASSAAGSQVVAKLDSNVESTEPAQEPAQDLLESDAELEINTSMEAEGENELPVAVTQDQSWDAGQAETPSSPQTERSFRPTYSEPEMAPKVEPTQGSSSKAAGGLGWQHETATDVEDNQWATDQTPPALESAPTAEEDLGQFEFGETEPAPGADFDDAGPIDTLEVPEEDTMGSSSEEEQDLGSDFQADDQEEPMEEVAAEPTAEADEPIVAETVPAAEVDEPTVAETVPAAEASDDPATDGVEGGFAETGAYPMRVWTSAKGNTATLALIRVDGNIVVVVDEKGRDFSLPFSQFSEEDQAYVRDAIRNQR